MADIEIGFGDSGSTSGINYMPTVGSNNEPTRLALQDRSGGSTQVEFSITANGGGASNTCRETYTGFPDFSAGVKSCEFFTFNKSDNPVEFKFWNLPAGTHELKIMSVRNAGGDRVGFFSFGTDLNSIDASYNDQVLSLFYTAAEGEDVTMKFYTQEGSFGYLQAAILLLAEPSLNTPINPSITNLLATSARLNWEQG